MAAFITATSAMALRLVTAVVGLATVVVTMPAIVAAARNIEVQQQVYMPHISSEQRCYQLHGHGRDLARTRTQEELAAEMTKRLHEGHVFPNTAFRSPTSVKILYTVVGLAAVQLGGWVFLLLALLLHW